MRSYRGLLMLIAGTCLLCFEALAQRQRIDSLLVVLNQCETDSACAEVRNWIGEQHQYITGDLDSALYYFQQAEQFANDAIYVKGRALYFQSRLYLDLEDHEEVLRTATESAKYFREVDNPYRLSTAIWLQGMYYAYVGPLEKAIELFQEAAILADSSGDYRFTAILYSNMGALSLQQGKRQEAVEYLLQAVEYRKKANSPNSPELLISIGSTYTEMEDYERAIPYFREAIKGNKDTSIKGDREDKIITALAYLAMSRAFMNLDQYDSARVNLERGKSLSVEVNDSTGIANYYESRGDISFHQADLDNAIIHYEKARQLMPVQANVGERADVYLNLAESHLQRAAGKRGNDLNAAKMNAEMAYDLTSNTDLLGQNGQAAYLLYQVYEALNQSETALQYAGEYISMNDSLLNIKRLQAVSDLQAKYETDKKQLEIDFLNQQQEQAKVLQSNQQLIIIILVVGIAGIGILLFVIYRTYLQKKKANDELFTKNKLIGKQNEEREVLLKEIHHRVKNNLQVISSLLDLQSRRIEDESLQLAFEDGQTRVQAMALIHQKLYQNEDIGNISFKEYAEQLTANLSGIYAHNNKVDISIDGKDALLDIDTAIPVGLILNELISNAFKYAFPETTEGPTEGQLKVKLEESEPGNFQMTVTDSGPGLPGEFNFKKARSLGLRLVRRLSQQLYGTSSYSFNRGSIFTVTFKDTRLRKAMG